ncbi:hypothetical protein SAMN05421770_101116 [Granulicella rosea]|uniref:O-Antigen ligase n=1 Tax=Granulicella rosea TaxID=474952 RepID=A0A239CWL7_9BACT|nr:hypothetical protein [Granulicella rosea]SNS23753.1 hypothetical protein SAMN05421770_101116 [Granulicella rosea]
MTLSVIDWLVGVAFFTSSFDVFGVLNIGGSLRPGQLIMVLMLICAMAKMLQSGVILLPRGGVSLLCWTTLQGVLLYVSTAGMGGIQLYLLLVFTVVSVFAMLQVYGRSAHVEVLMRYYLYSYLFIAGFGLFQFVTPSLHLGHYLVQQWIIHGVLPRVNGFSYEPSFFATYLLMGWIMLIDLRASRAEITRDPRWRYIAWGVGIIFFLSTSKTAWIFLGVEGAARLLPVLWSGLGGAKRRLARGDIRIALPRGRVVALMLLGAVLVAQGLRTLSQHLDLNTFLQGSGLNNTAAHSVTTRAMQFDDTWTVFKEQPLIGRSMGGVAARIAELHGQQVATAADLKVNWGFPVLIEVLAGSGVLGILPFLWFFTAITLGEFALIRRRWQDERAKWLRALVRALLYEFAILLVDQNLLRVYFWFHVTMVVIVGFHLRHAENLPYRLARRSVPLGSGVAA